MNRNISRLLVPVLLLVASGVHAADTSAIRVATVTRVPGCVAFWDFVQREPDGQRRFTAVELAELSAISHQSVRPSGP